MFGYLLSLGPHYHLTRKLPSFLFVPDILLALIGIIVLLDQPYNMHTSTYSSEFRPLIWYVVSASIGITVVLFSSVIHGTIDGALAACFFIGRYGMVFSPHILTIHLLL